MGINEFSGIYISSLDKAIAVNLISTGLPNSVALKVNRFLQELKEKGDTSEDGFINRKEFEKFTSSQNLIDFQNGSNRWVFNLFINPHGEKDLVSIGSSWVQRSHKGYKTVELTNFDGDKINCRLDSSQREKLEKIKGYGLKLYLPKEASIWGTPKEKVIRSEIDCAYKRFLALEESKQTGKRIVVIYDHFHIDYYKNLTGLVPHGISVLACAEEEQKAIGFPIQSGSLLSSDRSYYLSN